MSTLKYTQNLNLKFKNKLSQKKIIPILVVKEEHEGRSTTVIIQPWNNLIIRDKKINWIKQEPIIQQHEKYHLQSNLQKCHQGQWWIKYFLLSTESPLQKVGI